MMVAKTADKEKVFGVNNSCGRTVGGRCVGNCRITANDSCMRTVGGRCVGNCRITLRK